MISEVLAAVTMKITVSLNVTSCSVKFTEVSKERAAMKMEATNSFETLVNQSTRCHIQEDSIISKHLSELKYVIILN